MSFDFHGVMQDAVDIDKIGEHRAVEQKMTRSANEGPQGTRVFLTMAQVITTYCKSKVRPRCASQSLRGGPDVAQSRGQQNFVASSTNFTEAIFGSGEQGHDVGLGRVGKPETSHR
ncbi:MAG: hypothetical protein P4M00_08530 [Azospirillaceae bacterium]|nr:hypothetical protein [Azospirillaceae bacterium]